MSPSNAHDVTARAEVRNRGLRRVRRSTGLITAASAAGVAILAGGYAHAMPGKTSAGASVTPLTAAVKHPAVLPATVKHPAAPLAAAPKQQTQKAPQTQQAPKAPQLQQTPKAHAAAHAPSAPPTLKPPAQPPTAAVNNAPAQAASGGS